MGSLSVAYYTIAPISLDLLRPALLSETKNTRCGETGEARSRNLRLKRPLHYQLVLQSHTACSKSKAHKHLEPKGQATLAVISRKLVGVQGLEPWASRSQI